METFCPAGFFGCGLLQQFSISCATNIYPHQCDLGSLQYACIYVGDWRSFFKQGIRLQQIIGAVLSIAGVLLVLCRGDWSALANVQLVIGDVYVLIATACWAFYSWLLSRPDDPAEIRSNWAYFLMAQMAFGLSWSGLFTTAEWVAGDAYIFGVGH